jgi:signal transduction histidine kinase
MVVAAGLVFAVGGAAVVTFFARSEATQMDRVLENDLMNQSDWYTTEANKNEGKPSPTSLSTLDPQLVEILEASDHAMLVTLGRETLYWEGPLKKPLPALRGEHGIVEDADGNRWRAYRLPLNVTYPWGQPVVQVARPAVEMDDRVARVRTIVIVAGSAAVLLVGIPAWLLTGVALLPLARVREGAKGISGSADLDRRVPEDGPLEVKELATELNAMLAKLELQVGQTEAALEATRTFTADAGHELRTPLTSLRANLVVLGREGLDPVDRDRAVQDALRAHARLTAMIDALQVLARGDSSVGHRPERLDLAELTDAAVVDARRRHPKVGFELSGAEAVMVEGDADGLRMVIENLLENAARHGGAHVRVSLRGNSAYAVLTVDDDGPGIPEAERQRVFERFARGSSARNGTGSGLGLAIAAQQAKLHRGRLELGESPLGGARFELSLPA